LERAESAKASLESEREKIIRDLAEFEQDLRAQTLENQRFGAELQKIKLERQSVGVRQPDLQTEREYRATKDRLRVVSKELNEAKHRCDELQRWRDDHMCNP
jgi:chromosome segregation ATPase